MPKAEFGSTKHLANKLKSKGLQRLRWYCQICEKQCRDANAFKQHSMSESHVRKMLIVGEDPKKYINEYSNQFMRDFVNLLKTGHGEKQVHINHFYQEYIANKEHVHMNSTKWPSLTEFAKHLGRESICRVEETEKGLHISWIDNSPEALRRQEALRRKEAQNQGDEELEQRIIREQIKRAQANTDKGEDATEEKPEDRELRQKEGETLTLTFGKKPAAPEGGAEPSEDSASKIENEDAPAPTEEKEAPKPAFGGMSFKAAGKPQAKNVFAQAKKNALSGGSKKSSLIEQPKKISEAERIMKQEMDKKRSRESAGFSMPFGKKPRQN
ncbi:hypothetical protein Golomagni_07551 [Golovinomyces magnicellulatus]|nr:hypothetical protein Golomagni_07551 [Golovinomyces magnicellulatus]